jgi:hypothetical protein
VTHDKPFFISQNTGIGEARPEDELLHPQRNAQVKDDTLTETQYFGFCIAEERIHGYGYLWHHPNLHVVSGGIFVWRGHTFSMPHALLCDFRTFMSDAVLAQNLHEYRLTNGYGVKVLEPLMRHHVTYTDATRRQSIDLHYEAVSPAVMFRDGNHFEQAMKVTGEVVLRGKPYSVCSYTVRDRSWGKPRPEDNLRLPPMSWMQAVFSEDFAFNCTMFDQAESSAELRGTQLAIPLPKTLNSGWIWRDGKLGCVVSGRKRVAREPQSRKVMYAELELTDELGRRVHAHGHSIASIPYSPWHNIYAPMALMRWECDDQVAHGDYQEGVWNDYLHLGDS